MTEPRSVPKGSRCTRCLAVILPEEFEGFLFNDFLCPKCAVVEDPGVSS